MDEGHTIQVVAVTTNASLVIGLTFLGRGWDVASQAGLEDLPACDVLVLDTSGAEASAHLEVVDQADRPPCVVIADGPIEVGDGDRSVVRPYTLDELADAIETVAATADAEPSSDDDLTVADVAGPDSGAGDSTGQPATLADQAAPDVVPATNGRSPDQDAADQPGGYALLRGWAGRLSSKQPAAMADTTAAAHDDEPPLFAPIDASGTDPTEPHDGRAEAAADDAASEQQDEQDDAPAATVIDLTAVVSPDTQAGPARGSAVPPVPPPGAAAATVVAPAAVVAPAPEVVQSPERPAGTTQVLQPVEDRVPTGRAARFAARRQIDTSPEARVRRRLAEVVTAGSELESLVDEVPLLRSFPRLAEAIVHEVVADLRADTAAFFERRDDGFHVVASAGLTRTEQRLVSPLDQPMLAEVHTTGGGLLIDPIDAAQAAVAGIGGAHTESFMAASVAAGPGRYGILCVGRDDPLRPAELDVLVALANEAAPGVAVSALLHRLSGLTIAPRASADEIEATSDSVWGGRHS